MDVTSITTVALIRAYRRAVAWRLRRTSQPLSVRESAERLVRAVAVRLDNPRLAALFVSTQFDAMPGDWCRERFGKPYPPLNLVFGGGAWERYVTSARG